MMTEKEFNIKLRQYAVCEGHIVALFDKLKGEGYSEFNSKLLQKGFEKLGAVAENVRGTLEVPRTSETSESLNEGDQLALAMRKKIGEKCRISNSLWEHQDNPSKCREIVGLIMQHESEIENMRADLRHFNEKGEMPTPSVSDTPESKLPDTKFELHKKIESLRVMIKQVERELETFAVSDPSKLKGRERRLLDLKNLRDLAIKKMNEALV